jgi:hypothetical protein
MKKLLCIALIFAACAAPTLLDEDGDPIATGVTITQDRSSIEGTLEPEDTLDTIPEGETPAPTIEADDWTDDFLTPAAVNIGDKKWKKGKTLKDVSSLGVNTRRIPTAFNTSVSGHYKIKIVGKTGYMFASKVATATRADFSVPPSYTATRSACANFETWRTTYRREDHEYEARLPASGTKYVWVATGVVKTVLNVKPAKDKAKRTTPWSVC